MPVRGELGECSREVWSGEKLYMKESVDVEYCLNFLELTALVLASEVGCEFARWKQ